MTWKIALPMYNVSLPAFWQRADLLFSHTCGYPYLHALQGRAALVATPWPRGCGGCAAPCWRRAIWNWRDRIWCVLLK